MPIPFMGVPSTTADVDTTPEVDHSERTVYPLEHLALPGATIDDTELLTTALTQYPLLRTLDLSGTTITRTSYPAFVLPSRDEQADRVQRNRFTPSWMPAR